MKSTASSDTVYMGNQLASARGGEQGGLQRLWPQERTKDTYPSPCPVPTPQKGTAFFLSSSWLEVMGRRAALLEPGRPLCPGLRNMLGYGQERSRVPLLLTAHPLETLCSVSFLGEAVLGLVSSPELLWHSGDIVPVPQDSCCHCARKTHS